MKIKQVTNLGGGEVNEVDYEHQPAQPRTLHDLSNPKAPRTIIFDSKGILLVRGKSYVFVPMRDILKPIIDLCPELDK